MWGSFGGAASKTVLALILDLRSEEEGKGRRWLGERIGELTMALIGERGRLEPTTM